jgi:hypothetical protein
VPEIFNSKVHRRCHHYFGTPIRDHAKPLFEFWKQARRREVDRVYSDTFAHVLWQAVTSSFSLERWVAERKFGPHFVVARTPITNIRLTTCFAGEAEVRLVDPSRIRVLKTVGCTVAT